MDRIFEYAIIRFVPEAFRGEQVNIGLVVLHESHVDVRVYLQANLMRALGTDASRLDWIASHLRAHDDPTLANEERWSRVSALPGFALSERGWVSADTDEQYELRLGRIRTDYIDRPRPLKTKKRSSSLTRELRGVFRDYHIMGSHPEDVNKHKVVANVPVGPAGKLHVDFVVKNGVFHATETADFRNAQDTGVAELKEAALASFTLRYAKEQLGREGTQCYLVYSAPSLIEIAIAPALQIAEQGVDKVFNMQSGEQKREYLDLILAASGAPRFNSH